MTKSKLFSKLKTLIDTNYINLDVTKWVKRVAGIKKKKEIKRK